MLTTDLALRLDPAYEKISRRFHENPDQFADAFARAWFKLTHRDMGPLSRYLGPLVPKEQLTMAGPHSRSRSPIDRRAGRRRPEVKDPRMRTFHLATRQHGLGVGSHVPRQRQARWSERRAHSPGAAERIGRSTSRPNWPRCWQRLEAIQKDFNRTQSRGKKVSLADLIVLGGCAAVEAAAKKAGHDVKVPFSPGRMDTSQEQTDVHSFAVLEPIADGFRNYVREGLEGIGR
jgi:catalase-peroxidase